MGRTKERQRDPVTLPVQLEPADAISALRPALLRFARFQLRDDAAAEDAVQDALASALGGRDKFRNDAELKTWVFAILKHQIIDEFRKRARQPTTAAPTGEDERSIDELFDADGAWRADMRPADWGNPEAAWSKQEFWAVFELCIHRLTENVARVFLMREVLGLTTEEICKELGIQSSNCWVILHRARMGLRLCLQERWFGDEGVKHAL